jgi:hypothetical protein
MSPEWFLPWCDCQSKDVPDDILPESLASSQGACQTGCPERRPSSVVLSLSSFSKAYLLVPPLSPLQLLPQCDPWSRDVPNNILPETLASSPGACQIGCLKQRASPVATSWSSCKANLPPPLSYVSRMNPTLVWSLKQWCSWWHTTCGACQTGCPEWRASSVVCHHCHCLAKHIFWCRHCLHYDYYHSVTFKAGMCLTTYYLSLLQVHQLHAR